LSALLKSKHKQTTSFEGFPWRPSAACLTVALLGPSPAATTEAARRADLGTALAGTCAGIAALLGAALLLSTLLVLAGRLPGQAGAAAALLAQRCLPAALRAALVTALSVGAAATPALTGAAHADSGPTVPAPGLDLDRPGASTPTPTAEVVAAVTSHVPAAKVTDTVVVRPGDSLWRIAAAHLTDAAPAEVAAAWPRWWQANRPVIGDDPDLIHPGQRLVAPSD
jgi:nucleoid-associated protein YgaU